ncbi:intraflagellar transport protein 74 homolog [Brevipalpus obovatus]|uniref:intraflagellar transport protein 74 homolog n=1 Tax=Brevipalpus obovatus TaxID=246614 RepID=UPI003D9F8F40
MMASSVRTSQTLSSRPRVRTMTAVPNSPARPVTNTGLMAPRTARGRSAIGRQIQDKTYWMGILRAKMNELVAEISRLSKESEIMSRDEARVNVWQRKAESLARDLRTATMELSIYNEYLDRLRVDDDHGELVADIQSLETDNQRLSLTLETKFKEKKLKEEKLIECEKQIHQFEQDWLTLKRKFNEEQRERFERLENLNRHLTKEADKLEEKITSLREKQNSLEKFDDKVDSSLRKDLMKALTRLREVEKQKNDLTMDNSGGDERTKLLAQMKRDNQEIVSLEAKLKATIESGNEIESTLAAYEDIETAEKFRDLKRKESSMNTFLNEFPANLSQEIETMKNTGESISELMEKCNRYIRYIDTLKSPPGGGLSSGDPSSSGGKVNLIDEKRKLELDYNKIQQLDSKIVVELDVLRNKIKALTKDISTYSDISQLKSELEQKSDHLEEERRSFTENIQKLGKEKQVLASSLEKIRLPLEANDIYRKLKELENRLSDLAAINEEQETKIRANDNNSLKKQVMDLVNRYNQTLLGF